MQENQTKAGLTPANFSGKVDGKDVQMYVLTNSKGAEATIINYGAKIVSLCVPDKNGKLTDVVLGHNNLNEYLNSEEPYFGAVCGRTGNRIANGQFTLDGVTYKLAINNGPNNLHGGLKGFNAVVWNAKQTDNQTLELTYLAKDGEEGFPGNLNVKMIYKLTDDNSFDIDYQATTDKATILNLTNHSYFNLSGEGDPSVNDHMLVMHASQYLPTDDTAIPYGKPETVKGTPFDFTVPHAIGERIEDDFEQLHFGKGYDHTMVLDKKDGELALAVECYSPKTGIKMDIATTEPGVQIYTGNWMTGNFEGKHGHRYPMRAAVCFETQHFPDSINKPEYPSVVLRPEETFKSKTTHKFSVK
ncbi:aldose 1-epimerase [Dysgonomonas sp. PFB1-18]|uniref:aldose epimerase family protein n=1 Tax=unclassified Dysgonomonas TaxID=2630389 RepID=UPI00247484C5|nr:MULTISPECIES: aldose epimerase family protein [unclassified Dysgonomonas]MDH6307480.1 aldose 1-epimerase [Dysgonomonas sp. PF1-14]MDH6337398.1 aldose 1-epimerase [Dysgonomonas sp. PF1-16]MDH6379322.1 aldose 1-epimerase [Dysgonomonas sp. PFB1-18]MDH6396040.1 aldose 1-epimerase [Dysgonomonas sp. PF1-23]